MPSGFHCMPRCLSAGSSSPRLLLSHCQSLASRSRPEPCPLRPQPRARAVAASGRARTVEGDWALIPKVHRSASAQEDLRLILPPHMQPGSARGQPPPGRAAGHRLCQSVTGRTPSWKRGLVRLMRRSTDRQETANVTDQDVRDRGNGMGHVRWQRVGRTRQARTRILLDGFEADYLQPESIPSAADGCWLPRTGRMFGAQRGHRRGNTNEAGAERLRFLGGRRRSALGPAKFGVSNLDLWSATKRPLAACRQTG